MPLTTAADVPDGVPLVKVPISLKNIRDVADEHDVDVVEFGTALEEIGRYLAPRARDLTEQYTDEFGQEALLIQVDLQQHLYVESWVWDDIREELYLDEDIIRAAKDVHDQQASLYEERIDRVERVPDLERHHALVMPTPIIQDLLEGGLSYREAQVQALRLKSKSPEEISKRGYSIEHVESILDRVDHKIEQAEELLTLVDSSQDTYEYRESG